MECKLCGYLKIHKHGLMPMDINATYALSANKPSLMLLLLLPFLTVNNSQLVYSINVPVQDVDYVPKFQQVMSELLHIYLERDRYPSP